MPRSSNVALSRPSRPPKVAIAIDLYDWHAQELKAAFAGAGVTAVPIRLGQCGFDTTRPHGLVLPGFGAELPDLVFVRQIGFGTFESVTLRLGFLHSLGALGVPVVNTARAVELCVDKAATSFALGIQGIPTPPTWTVQSEAAARQIVRREGPKGPLVLKPLFGAQGFGLKLVRREEDLPSFADVEGVCYLQRFVAVERNGFRDIRLFVSRGEVVAGMTRHASHWITNVKLGARPEPYEPDRQAIDLALRSAAAVGADFAGVDMIRDATDRLQVLEVNSMPGWRGLQKVVPFRIAEAIVARLLDRIARADRSGERASGDRSGGTSARAEA
jgi:tetrahydromethanopterin:alpha-L-glutamate ligase